VPFGTQVDPKNITSGGSSDTPREWALLGGILGHTWALPAVDILSAICKEATPGDALFAVINIATCCTSCDM